MKTFAQLMLVAIFLLIVNPARASTKPFSDYQELSHLKKATATKNVLAHAVPRAQKHALKANNLLTVDDEDDDDGDDEFTLQVAYVRPRLTKPKDFDWDLELSDYVKVRLAVARAKALRKYNEIHS